MENEYQVLNHLHENETTNQRLIAQRTGLSLGSVNILIKKMTRKGLVKVEKLNSRTMRYILTPKGMQEKARLTYNYVRQSYKQILKINQALNEVITGHNLQGDGGPLLLYGPTDEIWEILTQYLRDQNLSYETLIGIETLKKQTESSTNQLIIIWREEEEEALPAKLHGVNIMKML